MNYSIRDLSKKFGMPTSTIRYYEKIGLLEDVEHENGYKRIYNDSHIVRLQAIDCFKKALLPLDEIKLFFSYEKDMSANSEKIVDMMKAREAKTEQAIKDMQVGLEHVKIKVRYFSAVDDAVKSGRPIPGWDEVFPQK